MIDWDQLKELKDQVGSEDFGEIVELFMEETQQTVDRMESLIDHDTLEEDLHFLKGSALNLGFKDLSDICQIGEKLSAKGKSNEVDLAPIVASYEASKEAFMQGLDKI